MVRNWKSASVGISLVLAAAALAMYTYTRAHAAPTYHLANGVEVTPIEIQPDDVAKVLDIKVWKFDVILPDAEPSLQLSINLCRSGKIVHSLGGGGFVAMKGQSHSNHLLLSLVMAPDEGDFSHGKQIKYFLETQSGNISNKFVNPLQGSQGMGYGPDVSEAENSVYLVGGGKTGMAPVRYNDTAIALAITPEKPF